MYSRRARSGFYIFNSWGENNKEEYAMGTRCGLQSLNYLCSGPLEDKFADPCFNSKQSQEPVNLIGGPPPFSFWVTGKDLNDSPQGHTEGHWKGIVSTCEVVTAVRIQITVASRLLCTKNLTLSKTVHWKLDYRQCGCLSICLVQFATNPRIIGSNLKCAVI